MMLPSPPACSLLPQTSGSCFICCFYLIAHLFDSRACSRRAPLRCDSSGTTNASDPKQACEAPMPKRNSSVSPAQASPRGPVLFSFYVLAACLLFLLFPTQLQGAEDFYKLLGVKRTASQSDIKRAWRRLSLELHPDKNPSPEAHEKFARASNAYEVLSNEEKREIYDREGEEGLKMMEQRQQAGNMDPFGGMFEAFGFPGFSTGRRRDEELKTPNVVIPLKVSLKQLYTGDIIEMTYVRQVLCLNHKDCMKNAPDCQGPGVRIRTQQIGPGFMQQIQVRDDSCVARGKAWRPNCKACPDGQTHQEEVTLTVDVQPGMQDAENLVFDGVADEKAGHTPGDLILQIRSVPHPSFTRQGNDLHVTMKVDLVDALTGFEKTIKHVDDRDVKLVKQDVTRFGEVQRIKGQGMPRKAGNGYGDLVVTWEVEFPKMLSEAQKKELRKVLG